MFSRPGLFAAASCFAAVFVYSAMAAESAGYSAAVVLEKTGTRGGVYAIPARCRAKASRAGATSGEWNPQSTGIGRTDKP